MGVDLTLLAFVGSALFLVGILTGMKLAWLDAYYKGREDAKAAAPTFDVGRWEGDWTARRRETDGAVSTWPRPASGSIRIP